MPGGSAVIRTATCGFPAVCRLPIRPVRRSHAFDVTQSGSVTDLPSTAVVSPGNPPMTQTPRVVG